MSYSILVLPEHSWLKNKYLMCLKLGCLSLLWPSGLVCRLGGAPLPVIGETEVKLGCQRAVMPSAEEMGRLIMEQGKWHRLFKTSALRHIQTSPPIQPLSESSCQPCIYDVIKGYTDVFDEDLSNLGHCNLITLTIKLNGCWPIKLRAYYTPLWIRKVVNHIW